MDTRLDLLRAWLDALPPDLGLRPDTLRPASNDASFRRYFRLDAAPAQGGSLVAMDAPPPMEDCRPFVHAAGVFARSGASVPRIVAADVPRGFLLLEDLGDVTYLSRLDATSAPALYRDAIGALVAIQRSGSPDDFPPYDRELLLRELRLFPDWYVARHKGVELTDAERATLDAAFETILSNVLAQPRVHVHRDYHSRNLMVLPDGRNPGILDFQDAVVGPITYDLVSLLRDAYVRWEEEQVLDWAIRYWDRARAAGLPMPEAFGDFYRDFEWMGLQRHLKVLGIFARLYHRDGKDRYLADLPLVLRYVRDVVRRYAAFGPLAQLIDRIEGDAGGVGYTF
ncbi:MAG TPA: phosphotransferase [Burkholderiaceae bacterium]|nr:phosphotransferase [Burkholderiaceae bacterium]